MANLVITNACNLGCPFCFASEYKAGAAASPAPVAAMSLDEVAASLEFTGGDVARLCGGEPTLHPAFAAIVDLALARPGGKVFLMTNGLWPEAARAYVRDLADHAASRITYLVNVLPPELYRPGQRAELEATLDVVTRPRRHDLIAGLGRTLRETLLGAPSAADRVTLGVTLDSPTFDPEPLFALARRFGVTRLRYSVAAPNVTDPRSWNVDPDRDFPPLARVVVTFVRAARARGLRVQSDCGYLPPCLFTPEELEELTRPADGAVALEHTCHGPVDLGPGGAAWRCYGLYSVLRARTSEFASADELGRDLERRLEPLEVHDLFAACADCELKVTGACGGGCHAHRLTRTMRARAGVLGLADPRDLGDAVPRLDPSRISLWRRSGGTEVLLAEAGVWSPLDLTPTEARVLEAVDGARPVSDIIAALGGSKPSEAEQVRQALRRFFALEALHLDG